MKVVAIADTHGFFPEVPQGDTLVHCGDITGYGKTKELRKIAKFFGGLEHTHKIFIAGNHDWCFQEYPEESRNILKDNNIIYLQDEYIVIEGIKFYGSPWTPEFFNWAFMLPRYELEQTWQKIPADTNVLLTHGPPLFKLDWSIQGGSPVGCEHLRNRIEQLDVSFHLFGHIHHSYGMTRNEHTTFINCSICDEGYNPINKPIVFDV